MDDDPLALSSTLIAIPSINSDLVDGASGESDIADFCDHWLRRRGFSVTRIESRPGHPSLIALSPGSGGGKSLMLNGHLDTVGTSTYTAEPFVAQIRDGKIFGRGAFDMKSGLAALLIASSRAAKYPHRGDIVVALVADEEFGSAGTEAVLESCRTDSAIIVEPSGLELTVAHRGFAWFDVSLVGQAAHGSQPEQGVDAIAGAGAVLQALDSLASQLSSGRGHPLLGHGSVRVSLIAGGVDAATVAPACTLTIERRTLPGEDLTAVEEELRQLVSRLCDPRSLTSSVTRVVARTAFAAQDHSPIVATLTTAATAVLGAAPVHRGEPFWTDAGLISAAGIDCVVFGVDGGGAHSDDEWATSDSVIQVTEILERTIVDFCA